MARLTIWPARRVGDRLLCGRPAPDGGCRGQVGYIFNGAAYPMPNMTEDPPGSGDFRLSRWAERKHTEGRTSTPAPRRNVAWRSEKPPTRALRMGPMGRTPPSLPWRTKCPTCRVLAEVLDS